MAKIRLSNLRTHKGTIGLFWQKCLYTINVGSYWLVYYFCTPNKCASVFFYWENGPVVQWIE